MTAHGAAVDSRACVDFVTRYLEACTERRFDDADAYLAGDRELVFPWGRFRTPAEVARAAQERYRWARKRFETWDVAAQPDGSAVVVVSGTLYGQALDGTAFSGIRFIDRFVIRDGRITLHQVWNDLAKSGIPAGGGAGSYLGRGG